MTYRREGRRIERIYVDLIFHKQPSVSHTLDSSLQRELLFTSFSKQVDFAEQKTEECEKLSYLSQVGQGLAPAAVKEI